MKLEYLENGAADCPLIRLFDLASSDALRLRSLFCSMVKGIRSHVAVHEEQGVQALADCRLHLWIGGQNTGIVRDGPANFHCVLTRARWSDMAGLCEPFCHNDSANGHQWLNEDGRIALLLSQTGSW